LVGKKSLKDIQEEIYIKGLIRKVYLKVVGNEK
jgi:hypothetical protein